MSLGLCLRLTLCDCYRKRKRGSVWFPRSRSSIQSMPIGVCSLAISATPSDNYADNVANSPLGVDTRILVLSQAKSLVSAPILAAKSDFVVLAAACGSTVKSHLPRNENSSRRGVHKFGGRSNSKLEVNHSTFW